MAYAVLMTIAYQGSLLDLSDEVTAGPLGSSVRRTVLTHGAWIDVRPGWIAGAGALQLTTDPQGGGVASAARQEHTSAAGFRPPCPSGPSRGLQRDNQAWRAWPLPCALSWPHG